MRKDVLAALLVLQGLMTAGSLQAGQLLRVPFRYAEQPEAARRLWGELEARKGAFTELALFTPSYHSVKSLDRHRAFMPHARRFLEEARRRGYVAGINVWTSVGFGEDEADPSMDGLPAQVDRNGCRRRGALCPSSPQVLRYVTDLHRLCASAGPSFVYVDDDVTCADCWCTNCIAAFARASGVLSADATAAELGAALSAEDPALRRKVREAWLNWKAACHAAVYAAAARGAREVDPSIAVGVMTCANTMFDGAPARWADAVRGGGGVVRYRPGGGNWTDASVDGAICKAELNVLQIAGLPEDVRVQAEIENFPYNSLKKTPDYMGWEALIDVAWNADEVAYNCISWDVNDLDEYTPFLSRAASVAPSARLLAETFGKQPAAGVGYPFAPATYLDVASRGWRGWSAVSVPTAFACIGLPTSSADGSTCVCLLNESLARGLAEAQLLRVLSGGVLMDAGALAAVNERGFGRLTGFALDGRAPRDAITRDLDMPLNVPGRRFRHLFAINGREPGLALIRKTGGDAARFSAEATDYAGKRYGFASGVFENERGGRVAVETMATFTDCEGKPRCEHLKRLMVWLSRERLPAYVSSFHRASVRVRGKGVFVTNVSSAPMSDVELALLGGGPRRAVFFCGGAKTSEQTLQPVGTDGAYALYRLASLPHLGQALIW